jgi:hypothetical protein
VTSTPCTATRNQRPADLLTDDRGAVMVIGVFMAMLVTGFLYYIIGIGNTIIYRERMQDAADVVAFGAAVTYAKGMNLVALINQIMALLVAIWMVFRIVQTILMTARIFCSIAFFICGGAVPAIEAADRFVDAAFNLYTNTIMQPGLTLGNRAQQAIRTAWPAFAYARALSGASPGATYRPPVAQSLLLPLAPRALPIKAVSIRRTCAHAARALVEPWVRTALALFPGIGDIIARFVAGVLARTFCPDDNPQWRPHEIDQGSGNCNDGMPGQDCEYVQLRGVTIATATPFRNNERGVAAAAWGQAGGSGGAFGALEMLGNLGTAQAEYYYEGTENIDEWMWNQRWRARLRRVQFGPMASSIPGIGTAASAIDQITVH